MSQILYWLLHKKICTKQPSIIYYVPTYNIIGDEKMLEQNYIFEIIRLELFDTIKEVLKQSQTVESG